MWQSAAALVEPSTSFFFCGPTGCGKTEIAASFPRPMFIFPRNEGSKETIRGREFPFTEVGTRAEMNAALDFLLGLMRQPSQSGRQSALRDWCDTVCVESLSHYSQLVEQELTNGGQREMGASSGGGRGQWGFYTSHFQHILDVLFRLKSEGGVNIVMTALNQVVTKGDRVIGNRVRIYGQTAEIIASSFDALGYCEQLPSLPPTFQVHFCTYELFNARTRIRGMAAGTYRNFNFNEHIYPHLTR